MPFRIQRVPRGLNELLSIFGGATPTELEDRVRSSIDIVQLYGAQQRTVVNTNNGALTEGTGITVVPSTTNWVVAFGLTLTVVKTATMTALHNQIAIRLNSDPFQELAVKSEAGGPFGATETGTVTCAFWWPYPLLCPPNTMFLGRMSILGTDANANCTLGAMIGIVG